MTLKERLKKLLESAGIDGKDQSLWLEKIYAIPFDKAEILVYILERFTKEDIIYFTKNLKEKISAISARNGTLLNKIFKKETSYIKHN